MLSQLLLGLFAGGSAACRLESCVQSSTLCQRVICTACLWVARPACRLAPQRGPVFFTSLMSVFADVNAVRGDCWQVPASRDYFLSVRGDSSGPVRVDLTARLVAAQRCILF